MRIIAGAWRGRPLEAPQGMQTRPTSDRAREGLFSMLASRIGTFEGLRVADLFAGSGALGFEALSRGAAHCLFVDRDRAAVAAIRQNAERLGAGERAEVRQQGAEHAGAPERPCDLIFLDPPYSEPVSEAVLQRLCSPEWLAPGGLITLETDQPRMVLPDKVSVVTERRFGKAHILIFRCNS